MEEAVQLRAVPEWQGAVVGEEEEEAGLLPWKKEAMAPTTVEPGVDLVGVELEVQPWAGSERGLRGQGVLADGYD